MAGKTQLDRIEERQAAIAEAVYALVLSQVLHASNGEYELLVGTAMKLREAVTDA